MGAYCEIPAEGPIYPYVFTLIGTLRYRAEAAVAVEARHWCYEQFGRYSPQKGVTVPWKVTATRAKFLDKTHAAAFKLRWC